MDARILTLSAEDGIPAHLRPYEHAARIYCQLRGENADQVVIVEINGNRPGEQRREIERILWELAAEKLVDMSMALTAMRRAAEETQAPKEKTN